MYSMQNGPVTAARNNMTNLVKFGAKYSKVRKMLHSKIFNFFIDLYYVQTLLVLKVLTISAVLTILYKICILCEAIFITILSIFLPNLHFY